MFVFLSLSDPSQIFRVHADDLCDIIAGCNRHRIVNKLVSASLVTPATKEDVKSTHDVYDKADIIVEKLQRQVDEHGVELLKKICDFLLEQTDKTLKDIGTRMMSQLPDISKKSNSLICIDLYWCSNIYLMIVNFVFTKKELYKRYNGKNKNTIYNLFM